MIDSNTVANEQENSHRGSVSSQHFSRGSQFIKPNLPLSNSSAYGLTRKNKRPAIEPAVGDREQLIDLPIYKLLKVFKLNQYAHKMNDMGYGQDVYKLALLSAKQREDFVEMLKVMPGHKAKIAGFFTVIDEMYPRSIVAEQIQSATPGRLAKAGKKKRITSATRNRFHMGPQKTLL